MSASDQQLAIDERTCGSQRESWKDDERCLWVCPVVGPLWRRLAGPGLKTAEAVGLATNPIAKDIQASVTIARGLEIHQS